MRAMLRCCDVAMLRCCDVADEMVLGLGLVEKVGRRVVLVARKGLVLVGDFTVGIVERCLGDGER
jgi:hypothetical protein